MLININIMVYQAVATCVMIGWDQTNGFKTHRILLLILRGRADKFYLHINRKWAGKKIFLWNKIKNKYAYINYFQSFIIIFLQNRHALQYTSANTAQRFETNNFQIQIKMATLLIEMCFF